METYLKEIKKQNQSFVYDKFVVMFLIWSVIQDFLLGFLYTLIPYIPLFKVLFYSKDIMMVALFLYALFFRLNNRNNKYYRLLMIYLIWIFIMFVVGITSGSPLLNAAASVRGFMLLPCYFVIGFSIKNKERFSKKAKGFIETFLTIVAIIGILEYVLDLLIGTKGFWIHTIGIGNFITDIKNQGDRLVSGLPGNFYGYSNGVFFTQKRLVSLWGGPLTAGYVLMIPFVYFLIQIINEKRGFIKFLINATAIVLTYTRAMILLCALIAFILIVFYKKKYKLLLIVIPVAATIIAWKYDRIITFLFDGSTTGHISNVITSLKHINILGLGFGQFGGYSSIGTESTYLSCLGQMGILGLVLYLLMNIYLAKKLRIIYLMNKDNLALTLYLAQVIYLLSGFISEQLLAATTMMPFYIISGSYIGYYFYCEMEKEKKALCKQSNLQVEIPA